MPASTTEPSALARLLQQQLADAEQLARLLQDEHRALLTSDITALATLVVDKQRLAAQLQAASETLQAITDGHPETAVRVADAHCRANWQRLGEIAEGLRQQNLRNGALLNERQLRLRWIAQHSGGDVDPLYARTGVNTRFGGGRSLARA